MATPPSFIQEAETVWTTNANSTASVTTDSFTVQANDVLVAFAVIEGYNPGSGNMTLSISDNTSGALTWTNQQVVQVTEYTWVSVWTTTTDARSMTVTLTRSTDPGTDMYFGANVLTFRGSDGVGASNKTNVSSGAPSLALTTTTDNAAIVAANGDWNAADGSSRTWRTINSITPTSGNGLERTYFRDSAHYTVYIAYWSDVGSAGSKTTGLSAPSGQKYSIAVVEVKGAAAAATKAPPPTLFSRRTRFFRRNG